MIATAEHLGGYVPGGDPWTRCERLWEWLIDEVRVESVIDIGCGDGATLDFLVDLGVNAEGVDGVEQDHPRIVTHDYTSGPFHPGRRFDVGWCCEFVEHVEQRHERNFTVTFQACDLLLLTHAFPGQAGHHHVNCQSALYWLQRLRPWFRLDNALTITTRQLADDGSGNNHYARSGLALRRIEAWQWPATT